MTTNRILSLETSFCTLVLQAFLCLSSGTSVCAQTVQNHGIDGLVVQPGRPVALSLVGTLPAAFGKFFDLFPVEASENLTQWTPLATVVRTNVTNDIIYLDVTAADQPIRFYRTPTNQFNTPFLAPTGPFTVGILSRMLTDPTRTNRYNIKTNSSFVVTFWYPAQSVAGQLPALYTDPKLASYRPYWGTLTNVVPSFVSHAFPEAPIASGGDQYPIIIYTHGLADGISEGGTGGGVRGDNTATAVELASYGYLVVAIDHIDCYGTVFPDGTRVLRGFPFGNVLNESGRYLSSRFQDIQFILGKLSQLAQTDPVFANRLDLNHVGIMGWSFGGGTAAEACRTNDQIKAAVLLDGYLDPVPVLSKGLQKPFLAMNSPSTGLAPSAMTLFSKATNSACVLQIINTQHETFIDQAWITEHTAATRLAAQAKNACVVSFFNRLFKNKDDHLLEAPTNQFANITGFHRKP